MHTSYTCTLHAECFHAEFGNLPNISSMMLLLYCSNELFRVAAQYLYYVKVPFIFYSLSCLHSLCKLWINTGHDSHHNYKLYMVQLLLWGRLGQTNSFCGGILDGPIPSVVASWRTGLEWTGFTQKSIKCLFQCRTEAKHTYSFTKVACIACFRVFLRVGRGQRSRAYLISFNEKIRRAFV